jgi:hypothetical protein
MRARRRREATKPKDQRSEMGLIDRLKFVLENPFERITYTDAIDILLRSKPYQKKQFQFPVEWGIDLQSEHERYLVEKHFKKPVIVTGYPAKIKAFYMRTNAPGDFGYSDKGKTVAAMDVLFPGIGEIIGGSQREERLDVLEARMNEMGVPKRALVVPGHAPLRHGAARGLRAWAGALRAVRYRHGEYPGCDPIPADAEECGVLSMIASPLASHKRQALYKWSPMLGCRLEPRGTMAWNCNRYFRLHRSSLRKP